MKPHHKIAAAASAELPTTRQRLLARYVGAIFADLIVLGLFNEYTNLLTIDAFSTTLITAVLLQFLLQGTLVVENWVAGCYDGKAGTGWAVLKGFSIWLVLFGSKFVILWIIDLILGEAIDFHGPMHGVVAFIAIVVAMLAAEELLQRTHRWLD